MAEGRQSKFIRTLEPLLHHDLGMESATRV